MEVKLSPQTIEALAFVISGGSATETTPTVGLYRSGLRLERFMRKCNVDLQVGSNSRLPALIECLIEVARGEDAQTLLPRIIEAAADPRNFLDATEKLTSVVDYLNKYLAYDGLELQRRVKACASSGQARTRRLSQSLSTSRRFSTSTPCVGTWIARLQVPNMIPKMP